MPTCAHTYAASATRSRAEVPSIELETEPEKPSSAATASGSSPRDVPARAADPYGLIASRLSRSAMRWRSRTSGQACARSWCDRRTGWACCMCVRPGMGTPRCVDAWSARACATPTTSPRNVAIASRRYIRTSVAIWSLRERPARSRPPSSAPSRSVRPRSKAPWTSSSVGSGPKAPDSTSVARPSIPARSPDSSSSVSSPAPLSARACAREPARSYSASLQSNCVDCDSANIASAGPPANRPPQSTPWVMRLLPSRV